jgi:hypothetical protein
VTGRFPRSATSAGLALSALSVLGMFGPPPQIASMTPALAAGSNLTVTLDGTGFDAKASAVEVVDGAGKRVAAGTVTDRGAARLVATLALAGVSPGRYEVRVANPDGTRSNGAALTLAPEVTISPARGRPGQPFTYVGRGFTGNSGATTHLQGPDGLEWQAKRYATSPEGTFEREISSGEFVPGTYAVWALDDRTRITSAKATFEVVAAPAP